MNKEEYYQKYPLVFPNGKPEHGFSCGNGWSQLLESFFEVVQKHLEKHPRPGFCISYIKEKWGTLRILCDNPSEYISQTVRQAEEMSSHICESCGEYGQIRDSAQWIKVRCEACERTHFAHQRLSPTASAALDAGLQSVKDHPCTCLGSFAKYADDED
jgi:hypothetical protein